MNSSTQSNQPPTRRTDLDQVQNENLGFRVAGVGERQLETPGLPSLRSVQPRPPLGRNSAFQSIRYAAWNGAVNSRSRAPALERTALEASASADNLARQEPRGQCVPRQEPRNKDINPHRVKYNPGLAPRTSMCWVMAALLLIIFAPVFANECLAQSSGKGSDDFPDFELKPLLPPGVKGGSALPPVADPDNGAVPWRSRNPNGRDPKRRDPADIGRSGRSSANGGGGNSGQADFPEDLPPVSDGGLPLRSPFLRPDPLLRPDARQPQAPADLNFPAEDPLSDEFDWSQQPVTLVDLDVGHPWAFDHTKPGLTQAESEDYVRLIRAAKDRRIALGLYLPDDVNLTSAWESAFYRFAEVRSQAWQNGTLLLQPRASQFTSPFDRSLVSTTDRIPAPTELKSYSVTVDMQSHPQDFVGRPVVLYGLFTPSVINQLQARQTLEGEKSVYKLQRGFLKNFLTGTEVALVDAESYVDFDSQKRAIEAWPTGEGISFPVLVKGWFVKVMGGQPLVYCDVVRVLTPRPYDQYIRDYVRNRRRVTGDESWLYYETLRQLQITSAKVQAGLALAEQQMRVEELMRETRKKVASDKQSLDNALRKGTLGDVDPQNNKSYQGRLTRLERQMEQRLNRYREYQQKPEAFPVFVDVFQHPELWQGHLVTMRGHVRRVTTHEGDPGFFDGQPLHELWLYTDDSQQNPAVIVTPSLPAEFPRSADIVDSVTVTGCLFKMYVYKSQDTNRVAPLLLAGRVEWNPTTDQILMLGKAGHLAADSRLLATAKANSGNPISETMVLLAGFVALLATMTVWGRVQRDRRERRRLLMLVDERPDFRQTSQDMYSGPFADSRFEPTRG